MRPGWSAWRPPQSRRRGLHPVKQRAWDSMSELAAWQLKSGEFNLKRVPASLFALLILSVAMGTASDCNHHCLYYELDPINVAFEK